MVTNTENKDIQTTRVSAEECEAECAVDTPEEIDVLQLSEEEQIEMLRQMQPTIIKVCRDAVKPKPFYAVAKRAFDIVASAVGLVLLSPVFAIIAHKIRKESPGPAFFKQKRVGKNGEVFMMYKFRSMYIDAEERIAEVMVNNIGKNSLLFKSENDDRITPMGNKIRDNSIDELPQLINILRGEMSFVGPRPPLIREVIQYEDHQTVRLAVKGGLTGFWQITGRNDADFDFCLEQDKKYMQKRNFWLDLWLVIKTVFGVIGGKISGR